MPRIEPALAQRLETLTGEDASCCVDDYRAELTAIKEDPAYAPALERYKALSDERRLLALALIDRSGQLCACEVQAALGLNHATISHHMTVLTKAGLVTVERRGRWAYYKLTPIAQEMLP